MTDNTDAKIAREWAEKALGNHLLNEVPLDGYRAAARYILATAPMLPMSDMEWDDSVHAGLCAEHPLYGVVRMLEYDHMDRSILCLTSQLHCEWSEGYDLTPLPGTRVDLTPRREPEPESTPDHPAELTTQAEYRNAPTGTVVAADAEEAWTKGRDGLWETFGIISGYNNYAMPDGPRRVLRWGWEA